MEQTSGGGQPVKVSVITAVRNGVREIRSTLDSVAGQSHPSVEHIVVDGASTDGTPDVVRRYGAHVSRLVTERDRGVYDAFDKGLRFVTGDVVAYLNAGDVYTDPGVLGRVAEFFARTANLEAVLGDVDIVDEANRTRVVRRYRCGNFTPDRLADGFMPAHPALFVRRSTYGVVGGYDHRYKIAGDFDFCVRAFALHRISFVHMGEVLVHMPRGGLSTSGWRSKWIITREMKSACDSHGLQTSYFRLLGRLPIKALEMLRGG